LIFETPVGAGLMPILLAAAMYVVILLLIPSGPHGADGSTSVLTAITVAGWYR
jgi:hypothetical protein